MSMTTIVTIVIVVVTLVLALVLIKTIFSSSTSAVTQVNSAIQNQINQLFTTENTNLVIYPEDRQVQVSRGGSPSGFAFSVKNDGTQAAQYNYNVAASDVSNCGSAITLAQANSFVLGASGPISIAAGQQLDLPILVEFSIPKAAVPCTVIYSVTINETTPTPGPYESTNVFLTIK